MSLFVVFSRPFILPQSLQTQYCHGDCGHLPLDFLLGDRVILLLVYCNSYWYQLIDKSEHLQLVKHDGLHRTTGRYVILCLFNTWYFESKDCKKLVCYFIWQASLSTLTQLVSGWSHTWMLLATQDDVIWCHYTYLLLWSLIQERLVVIRSQRSAWTSGHTWLW